MIAIGFITLACLGIFTHLFLSRLLREECSLTRLALYPVVSAALFLTVVSYAWRWCSMTGGFLWLIGLTGLGSFALLKLDPSEVKPTRLATGTWLYLLSGGLLVLFYALFGQTTGMVVDGDLFMHITEIGLFQEGHYPPKNPFLRVPTHGHFGRQMLIAGLASMTSLPFLEVEWLTTCLFQVSSFLLCFSLVWRSTRSQWQASLASAFAFFAANVGSAIGIADTTSNHNPTAIAFWLFAAYLLLRVGPRRLPTSHCLLVGGIWGSQALVYEIHYLLILLSIPLLLLVCHFRDPKTQVSVSVLVASSIVVALTAGGALSDLAFRKLGLKQQNTSESAAQQKVEVRFPKPKLFQVRQDNLRPSRPFEGKWRPWSADFTPQRDYTSIFSRQFINYFWYPAWLFPLCWLALVWKRNRVGVLFSTTAIGALLTPALVDFGFFEGETLRWLFVYAVSSSLCLGLALAWAFESLKNRAAKWSLLFVVVLLSSVGLQTSFRDATWALRNPGQELPIGRPGVVPGVGLVPRPYKLLEHHLGIEQDDRQIARWLRENAAPEALILNDDSHRSVNARAATIGLQARFPAAYLAPREHSSDPSDYRLERAALEFWSTYKVRELDKFSWDYLVFSREKRPGLRESLIASGRAQEVYNHGGLVIFRKGKRRP